MLMMCYIHTAGFSCFPFLFFAVPQIQSFAIPWMEYHENFAIGMKWLLFVGLLMWMSFDWQLTCDFMWLLLSSSILLMFAVFVLHFGLQRLKELKCLKIDQTLGSVRFTSLLDSLFAPLHFSSSFLVIAWACTRLLTHAFQFWLYKWSEERSLKWKIRISKAVIVEPWNQSTSRSGPCIRQLSSMRWLFVWFPKYHWSMCNQPSSSSPSCSHTSAQAFFVIKRKLQSYRWM